MFTRFAFYERRERSFFYHFLLGAVSAIVSVGIISCIIVIGIFRILRIDNSPSWFQNFLAAYLEFDFLWFRPIFIDDFAQYGGCGEFTIRIEHTDKTFGDKVIDICLHIGESCRWNTCWDDGMVVGHLTIIKYLLAFRQLFSGSGELLDKREILLLAHDLCLAHSVEDLRTFRIDVIGKKLCIYTRISRVFLLVETLDEFQRNISRVSKFLVAIHLE